jgi:hypothetical protein
MTALAGFELVASSRARAHGLRAKAGAPFLSFFLSLEPAKSRGYTLGLRSFDVANRYFPVIESEVLTPEAWTSSDAEIPTPTGWSAGPAGHSSLIRIFSCCQACFHRVCPWRERTFAMEHSLARQVITKPHRVPSNCKHTCVGENMYLDMVVHII